MSALRTLRVVLVDRHALLLAGVRCALESVPDIEVVGEARTDGEALALMERVEADVVMIDPLTSCTGGMSAVAEIRARHPGLAIIVMSASTDALHIDQALANGASVYVVKSIHPGDLPSTIRQVVDGTVHHVRPQSVETMAEAAAYTLNARELSIVSLVADGLSNGEIGRRLYLSDHTVKHYLRQAYRKLGVNNRTGAASVAYRRQILQPAVSSSKLSVGA
jgi:DNA-binding NarL/FixJ family response regulator